ncbi:MAG TPA: glycosyltransferase, partial [Ilumatobacteraceae bacterium]|nr:glycosyltransferase [Ilumatobacteraceae bacterium]
MTVAVQATVPAVAILLPCHDEATYLPSVLDVLLAELPLHPTWRLVAVNDSSTDETGAILDAAAQRAGAQMHVIHGAFGSPGRARSVA